MTPSVSRPGRWLFILTFCTLAACASTPKEFESSSDANSIEDEEPYIRVLVTGRGGGRILKLPLETYLAGVIGHEMSSRWPVEALKSQTIAARSYALFRMHQSRRWGMNYDVVDSQADQVFREHTTKNGYLRDIVAQTRGQVLWKGGRVVQAFYSSTCGGQTETAAGAELATDSPLKKSGSDKFCAISPFSNWTVAMDLGELTSKMQRRGLCQGNITDIRVSQRNPSGYVKELEVTDCHGQTADIAGKEFRRLVGSMRLKSLLFDVQQTADSSVTFAGSGFGHGVGLCQYGAKGMAQTGKNYRQILTKYYPKIDVKKIY